MDECNSFCSHGGVCTLELNHDGPHDSTYCTWTNDEQLTRAEADQVLSAKPGGSSVVAIWDILGL
jgi:hypothetical protein